MSLALGVALALAIAANVAVSARYRLRAREMETIPRHREPAWLRALRAAIALPPLLVLALLLLAPDAMSWARVDLPAGVRWAGVALVAALVPLNVWILRSLGANVSETVFTKQSHRLVVAGPYRLVRHPLYAAGFLMLAGIALATASWLVGALCAVAAAAIRWVVVPLEEDQLERRFGERYRDYRRRTGALAPRLRPPGA